MSQGKVRKVMQRFDPPTLCGGLLAPVTILGTPAEAGLNQKNSTSLTLRQLLIFIRHRALADQTVCWNFNLFAGHNTRWGFDTTSSAEI
jgi:hypothetical protein